MGSVQSILVGVVPHTTTIINKAFKKESNFGIKTTMKGWIAIEQIKQSKPKVSLKDTSQRDHLVSYNNKLSLSELSSVRTEKAAAKVNSSH